VDARASSWKRVHTSEDRSSTGIFFAGGYMFFKPNAFSSLSQFQPRKRAICLSLAVNETTTAAVFSQIASSQGNMLQYTLQPRWICNHVPLELARYIIGNQERPTKTLRIIHCYIYILPFWRIRRYIRCYIWIISEMCEQQENLNDRFVNLE
jgi:hypothetical protein